MVFLHYELNSLTNLFITILTSTKSFHTKIFRIRQKSKQILKNFYFEKFHLRTRFKVFCTRFGVICDSDDDGGDSRFHR